MSHQFLITSRSSEIELNFKVPLELEKESEIGLISFSVYNTIFNINKNNNKFEIAITDKVENIKNSLKEVTLSPGAYEIKQISLRLNEYYFKVEPDLGTSKCILKSYVKLPERDGAATSQDTTATTIDQKQKQRATQSFLLFKSNSFFSTILGFTPDKIYSNLVENISKDLINITSINSIIITSNLISNNFISNEGSAKQSEAKQSDRVANPSDLFYSFPHMIVPFGAKIKERPANPIYTKINYKTLDNIKFRVTSETGELIDFNNEVISLFIHIRPI